MKKVGLIGIGWHARRVYVPWLSQARTRRALLQDDQTPEYLWTVGVDLESAAPQILSALGETEVPLLFSPTAAHEPIAPEVLSQLEAMCRAGELDTLIISVDPIGRRGWIEWALRHDLDLLIDKPLTAPRHAQTYHDVSRALHRDVSEIHSALERSRSRLWIQAQRRFHHGYLMMRQLVEEVTAQSGVPITHLDISHADGMWVMPHEWDRDHHPYQHGWGKLLHSGYHFVDLAAWLMDADQAPKNEALHMSLNATSVSAREQSARLRHQQMIKPPELERLGDLSGERHGEVDLFVIGKLSEGQHARTTLNLQLMQSSISRRPSGDPPVDPYKGAGRIRHERVSVHVGPLLKIEVHSYQSHEVRDPNPQREYGPGHLDHFDLHIYRSPLLDGPRFERREIGGALGVSSSHHIGHNERARISLLETFLGGDERGSSLEEHIRTHELICAIYDQLGEER